MSETTVLDLVTRVDVGPLKAGMADAAASVQSGAASIAAALMRDGESADAAASALKNLGFSAAEAKTAVNSLNIAINENAAVEEVATRAVRSGISERMAASASLRVLEGNMMGSTRAAGAFLSTTLGLGPALQAAFPVIGAIALIDVLAQIPKTIGKMQDALAGWGAEEKRIFGESIHEAAGLISVYDSLARREAERAGAGQAGSGKYEAQINALGEYQGKIASVQQTVNDLTEALNEAGKVSTKAVMVLTPTGPITQTPVANLKLDKYKAEVDAQLDQFNAMVKTQAESKHLVIPPPITINWAASEDEVRKQLEELTKMMRSESIKLAETQASTTGDSVAAGLEKAKAAATEYQKQMEIIQKGIDALTKSTGETFSSKGQAQTAGVGSEGTDIAKLMADQNAQTSKYLNERLSLEQKTAEASATADKKAADESTASAIKTEQGYEASLRGQEKVTEDSYAQQIDQLEKLAGRKKITWAAESSAVQGLYQQEEAALQVSLDKQIDAAIMTAQLEAAKRNEILSDADATELASVQRLEQEKLAIHEQFLKKEQDAEFKANQEMEKSVNDFVSEGTSAFNNFLITITTTKGKGSEFRFLAEEWQKTVFTMEKDFLQMILRTAENTAIFRSITEGLKNSLGKAFSAVGLSTTAGGGGAAATATDVGKGGFGGAAGGGIGATNMAAFDAALKPATLALTQMSAAAHAATTAEATEAPATQAATAAKIAEAPVTSATVAAKTAEVPATIAATTAQASQAPAVLASTAAHVIHAPAVASSTLAHLAHYPAVAADTIALIAHKIATFATSFDEGGYVPRTGMAVLHAGERVATPDMWSEIGDMGKRGGDSEGGGHTFNINHHAHIDANDAVGFDRVIRRYSSTMSKQIMRQIKSGALRLPR